MAPHRPAGSTLLLVVALLLQCIIGCTSDGAPDSNSNNPDSASAAPVRLVSLSPAISRTLVDFELDQYLVGCTPFCPTANDATVIGDLHDVNHERLIKLAPTHVLVQPPAGGLSDSFRELAGRHGWALHTWSLNDIGDIAALIDTMPEVFAESAPDLADRARQQAEELSDRLSQALRPLDDGVWRGRTLLLAGTDPVLVYGSDTYLDDLLRAMGVPNATETRHWSQLSMEDVTRLNPEAVILLEAGADESTDPLELAGPIGRLDIAAIRENRVGVLTHPDAILPSSAIIEVAAELRAVLNGFNEADS